MLDAARTNTVEIRAATLLPVLRSRIVYSSDGWRIGRVMDLRVTPDGNGILALVRRRPLLAGGRVGSRVGRLRETGSRLITRESRAQVRALPRT